MLGGNDSRKLTAGLPLTGAIFLLALGATAQERLPFIGIDVDEDAIVADTNLYRYLQRNAPVRFDFQPNISYEAAIHKVTEWNGQTSYVAHMTPYACVAAAMLGAKFEVLATYNSGTTKSTFYKSYFVGNRKNFPQPEPELSDVYTYLSKNPRSRFLYHDRFSTSGYFLPSLYFRVHRILDTGQAPGHFIPINVVRAPAGESSSYLVKQVADGGAELAAVWDGTKTKFEKGGSEYQRYGTKVRFIPLEGTIPNDLLVASVSLPDELKKRFRQAIGSMQDSKTGWKPTEEFQSWQDLGDGSDGATVTLGALADLRRSALERLPQVPVRVQAASEGAKKYVEAAEQAVRLSGSEFVVYDPDFHRRPSVTWTLELTHDETLILTSELQGFDIPQERFSTQQRFSISFQDANDLTQRINNKIHSEMHRIRYVWPYEEKRPAVIRDVDFTPDERTSVQRISWADLERNDYQEDSPFLAKILDTSDPHKFQLDAAEFPKSPEGTYHFDPMSNVAYRVVLIRPAQEWTTMWWLTVGLVGVFLLACGGLVLDLRRKRPPPVGFRQTCRAIVDRYHRPWRTREIAEGDVLWCGPEIGKFINQIQGDSLGLDDLSIPGIPVEVKLPVVRRILRKLFPSRFAPDLRDQGAVGAAAALESVIQFLVVKRRLAPFLGRPTEWDALDEMASGNFADLGGAKKPRGEKKMDAQLQRNSRALSALAANHFRDVLQKCQRDASFFCQTWQVEKNDKGYRIAHSAAFDGEMRVTGEEGPVRAMVLDFEVPAEADLSEYQAVGKMEAWVLGRIVKSSDAGENGTRHLHLSLKPLALLRSPNVEN